MNREDGDLIFFDWLCPRILFPSHWLGECLESDQSQRHISRHILCASSFKKPLDHVENEVGGVIEVLARLTGCFPRSDLSLVRFCRQR